MELKATIVGLTALGGAVLTTGSALAMANGLPQIGQSAGQAANVEQVRWVRNTESRVVRRPGPRTFGVTNNWGGSWGPGPLWVAPDGPGGPVFGPGITWGVGGLRRWW